ncbi:MAG: cytochrome c [Bacteroidetes bacterium]|nr:MAG: cytochrome c [Bacteroidota bacterium]
MLRNAVFFGLRLIKKRNKGRPLTFNFQANMNILWQYFSFFGLFLLLAYCTPPSEKKTAPSAAADGQTVYRQYCVTCHGVDGTLGLNGAGDLTRSTLSLEERIVQVTKGKNLMTPFEGILTPAEIEAVATYTLKLNNNGK